MVQKIQVKKKNLQKKKLKIKLFTLAKLSFTHTYIYTYIISKVSFSYIPIFLFNLWNQNQNLLSCVETECPQQCWQAEAYGDSIDVQICKGYHKCLVSCVHPNIQVCTHVMTRYGALCFYVLLRDPSYFLHQQLSSGITNIRIIKSKHKNSSTKYIS